MKTTSSEILIAGFSPFWALNSQGRGHLEVLAERFTAAGMSPTTSTRPPILRRVGRDSRITIYGPLVYRNSPLTDSFGLTSYAQIFDAVRRAATDMLTERIVIEFDSPGGEVSGAQELAAEIRNATARKPIVAFVNSVAASAAYWLASQCSEISITPSGMAGSIGVIASHIDQSRHDAQHGFRVTYVHAGPHKAEGNPHEPLSGGARAHLQAQVDEYYMQFVADVAAGRSNATGRSVSPFAVSNDYGQGRMLTARHAFSVGAVDHIRTLDQVIANRPRRRA